MLIVMSGVPGSGKTTFIKELKKAKSKLNMISISRDEIRFSLLKEDEPYFAHEKETFKIFVEKINEALKSEEYDYVIADATHLNKASRHKLLSKLDLSEHRVVGIQLITTLEKCLENNRKRTGRALVPDEAIVKAYFNLEDLNKEEGFDECYTIHDKNSCESIFQLKPTERC